MSGDLLYSNSVLNWKGAPKIIKVKPHEAHWTHGEFIMGFAGIAHEMISLMDFYMNPEAYGGKVPKTRETKALILTKKGIFFFDRPDTWMRVREPYHSIGSGSTFATGAMAVGASTKEAILAATKSDPWTGKGVTTIKLNAD